VALIASPLLAIVVWLIFQHRPAWYQPAVLNAEALQRARREAVAAADDFGDRLVVGRPFEVVLEQRAVNEWLAALPEIWPDARDALPPELTAPAVYFGAGAVRVAAHARAAIGQAIVSLELTAHLAGDGRSLRIVATRVRGGSLPIPAFVLQRIDGAQSSDASSERDAERITIPQLLTGLTTRNRFVWPNGERAFRIVNITSMPGVLRLQIEPL
jgi:hypothetical protein